MPDVWTHFPLELVFGWADRLAFWHADVLLPRPVLQGYAQRFEHVSGPLNAKGNDVALEEITLAYERLELE